MKGWRKDLRYTVRMLRKSPALAALAVVALGLGIGLTTVMFSIVHGALLKGLPFEGSDRIVHLERNALARGEESLGVPIHDLVDWREAQRSFEGLAGYYDGTINVSGFERAERYDGAFVSANLFDLLRVRPALGRGFRPGEDDPGAPASIVLSWHVWQGRFSGDSSVVGRTLRVNGEQATVLGVMPEGFRFPIAQDVWVPLRMDPSALPRGEGTELEVVGRLRPGVSPDAAAAEMAAIASRLASAHPETNDGVGAVVQPFVEEYLGEEPRAMLWTMLAAVFLVLLIACGNVANLLLVRASTRSRELAIRSAIGASRARVILQLLSEGVVLAGAGAVLGLGIAWVGIRLFNRAIAPTDPPFWIDIGLDPTVLAFVVAVAVLAGILAGIAPALKASGRAVNEVLKDESWGSTGLRVGRLSKALVVAEIALSVGLLVGAGLMIRSVTNLRTLDYGFATEGVLTARLGLFETDYPDTTSRRRFFDRALERLEALPGAEAATVTTSLPGTWSNGTAFEVEGAAYERPQDRPGARRVAITPGYFRTFGVEARRGRTFDGRDGPGAMPVAIVNESFARTHLAGGDPVGRRIRLGPFDDGETPEWRTVVGVVPDMFLSGVEDEEPEGIYVPLRQADARFVSLVARTGGDPMRLAGPVREAMEAVDPDTPLYWVRTLQDAIDESTWFYRVFGVLFMVFGAVALFLASLGLYGVMAASVTQRTVEMGVRMALGAEARDVRGLVLRQGARQMAVGLAFGLGLAALLSRGLDLLLFRVEPWDPITLAAILTVLAATGFLATLLPARRATRVQPMAALRYE